MEYLQHYKTGVLVPITDTLESNKLPITPTNPSYAFELLKQLTAELTLHNFILTELPFEHCLPWEEMELRELLVEPFVELALYSYPSTSIAPPVYPGRVV